MSSINPNTFLWQLTVAEFSELMNSLNGNSFPDHDSDVVEEDKTEYVYGISGLARILGCSKSHAGKLKSSGMFDEAIIQNGRKIIIDKEKAIKLFNKQKS